MRNTLDCCYFCCFQSLSTFIGDNRITVNYKEQNDKSVVVIVCKNCLSDKWPNLNLNGSSNTVKTQNELSFPDLVPSWGLISLDCLIKKDLDNLSSCQFLGFSGRRKSSGRNGGGKTNLV